MNINIKNKKTKKIFKILPFILSVLFILNIFNIFNSAAGLIVSADDSGVKIHINTENLAKPQDITAEAAILLNSDTGSIVYEKNSQKIIYPASTVKIMTAIIVLENVADLESQTIISKYVVDNTTGNAMYNGVSQGEVFKIAHLLNAMLLQGANDAALALAEFVSGSVEEFVVLMNRKAVELGCQNTVFTNPTGMHSADMYTTVSDMAAIAFYASKIQKLMDITSTPRYDIPATNKEREIRTVLNRNHFISKTNQTQYYYEYARGINYGYTPEAGYCLTTVAEQMGLSYLCIVMGSNSTVIPGSDSERINCFYDAKTLFEWAFSIYSYKTVVSTKDIICSVKVELGANLDEITLYPDTDISVLLPQNANIETEITKVWEIFYDPVEAPIETGQILGKLTVYYNGEEKGTANLLSNANVETSAILLFFDWLMRIVSGVWFKASVTIFIVLSAFYIIISLTRKDRRDQRRYY